MAEREAAEARIWDGGGAREEERGAFDLPEILRGGALEYGPAAMWFTGGEIDLAEMTRQMEGFAEAGIRDVFLHPTNGTRVDYLGPYFFRMVRHAAAEAKRLGLGYWIYDEYNWPSGIAAGQVLRDEPWTHQVCLYRYVRTARPGETVVFDLPDPERYDTKPLLFAVRGTPVSVPVSGGRVAWTNCGSETRELEIYLSRRSLGRDANLTGSEIVADEEGYLDVLDRDAVRVFLEKTHEAYRENIGGGFGKWVRGVFTDEPAATYPMFGPGEETVPTLPWSRRFAEEFAERRGYDLIPRLPELFREGVSKLHADFWDTVSELFTGSFAAQAHEWCRAHGLVYTGHLGGEETWRYCTTAAGGLYEFYRELDWPGVDSICTYYRMDDFNFNVAAKQASSAARFLRKPRVLCETFTVSGWDIRLRDMKRAADRLALLGVDCVQFMGARYDFSPVRDALAMTNNWQNPLFVHYRTLSRYISSLQAFVAGTEYSARALLLHPVTSARAEACRHPKGDFYGEHDMLYACLLNSLLRLHVPFEIGYEQVIDGAELRPGVLRAAGTDYDVVILPDVSVLREKTFRKLAAFAAGGGRLILANGAPRWILGEDLSPAPALDGAVPFECRDYEVLHDDAASSFEPFRVSPAGAFTKALREALAGIPERVFRLEERDGVLSALRRRGSLDCLMVLNDSEEERDVRGEILGGRPFRALSAEDGSLRPLSGEGGKFRLTLRPLECVILEIGGSSERVPEDPVPKKVTELPVLRASFRPDGSNTGLPRVYQVRGRTAEALWEAREAGDTGRISAAAGAADGKDLFLCGRKKNPYTPVRAERDWFGWQPLDGNDPAGGEPLVAVYEFELDGIPPVFELVTDPEPETFWVLGGAALPEARFERVWTRRNPVYDLRGAVRPGRNRLVSFCTPPAGGGWAGVPPAVLRGDFRQYPDRKITLRPGGNAVAPWDGQGYLCYTGDGTYSAEFTAPGAGRVLVRPETRDAFEVFCNGRSAGVRLWDPPEVDVTPFVRPGVNRIDVRVTGTKSALLYGRNPSGLEGLRILLET